MKKIKGILIAVFLFILWFYMAIMTGPSDDAYWNQSDNGFDEAYYRK